MLYALLNTTFSVNSFKNRISQIFLPIPAIKKKSNDKTNGGLFTVFQNNCQYLLKLASTRLKRKFTEYLIKQLRLDNSGLSAREFWING